MLIDGGAYQWGQQATWQLAEHACGRTWNVYALIVELHN